jgi:formate hydrogenlyase subunit 3/multisubunit Na+/H+ antiporter MnhD subunit
MKSNYAVLLIAIPLVIAFLQPLFSLINKKLTKWITFVTVGFNFIYSLKLLKYVMANGAQISVIGNWRPPFGINLYLSPFSMLFATIIYFVALVVLLVYLIDKPTHVDDRMSIATLLMIMAAGAITLTGDIFNMFVFVEILSISTVILISFNNKGVSFKGAFRYIVLASLGSSMILLAIGFIYGSLGTLNLASIAYQFNLLNPVYASLIVFMFMAGIMVEAELFPFNAWVPEAYKGSKSYLNALLSGVVGTTGIYVLLRMFITIFGSGHNHIQVIGSVNFNAVIIIIGVLTTLIGEFSALSQRDIKKILAFSSMAQMGIIAVTIGVANMNSISGGIFHLINHAFSKSLLFVVAFPIINIVGSANIDKWDGLGRKNLVLAIAFAIGSFGLIGLPFFNGFWSKMMIVESVVSAGGWMYLVIGTILLSALIETFYFFRIIFRLFINKNIESSYSVHIFIYLAILILSVIVIYIGVKPSYLSNFIHKAAIDLVDKSQYINNVLGVIK